MLALVTLQSPKEQNETKPKFGQMRQMKAYAKML